MNKSSVILFSHAVRTGLPVPGTVSTGYDATVPFHGSRRFLVAFLKTLTDS